MRLRSILDLMTSSRADRPPYGNNPNARESQLLKFQTKTIPSLGHLRKNTVLEEASLPS